MSFEVKLLYHIYDMKLNKTKMRHDKVITQKCINFREAFFNTTLTTLLKRLNARLIGVGSD